jgi:hypothetical protein
VLLLAGTQLTVNLQAHTRSESFSRWQYAGQTLSLRFTVAAREATRIPQRADAIPLETALADYLDSHVIVEARESGCTRPQAPRALASQPDYLQIEAIWHCAEPPIALREHAFFDLAAEHTHFASYEFPGGLQQRLMTGEDQVWQLDAAKADDASTGAAGSTFMAYVRLGFLHIISGPDHVVFLLALLLICRRMRDLIWAITGFTLGHSMTLSLAALGLVQVNVPAMEAIIGLTIALVAVERTACALKSALAPAAACAALLLLMLPFAAGHGAGLGAVTISGLALFSFCYLLIAHELSGRGSYRVFITALFGLAHGFGFAGAFLASKTSVTILPWSLAGFNIGVELGQLALVAVMISLGILVNVRSRPAAPAADLLSAVVCGCGVFWFVQRSIF